MGWLFSHSVLENDLAQRCEYHYSAHARCNSSVYRAQATHEDPQDRRNHPPMTETLLI